MVLIHRDEQDAAGSGVQGVSPFQEGDAVHAAKMQVGGHERDVAAVGLQPRASKPDCGDSAVSTR